MGNGLQFKNSVVTVVRDLTVRNRTKAASSVDKEKMLKAYFHRGYPYTAIVSFLEKRHGEQMHVRMLKRKLKELGLKRRVGDFDEDLLRELIKLEMQGSGSLAG